MAAKCRPAAIKLAPKNMATTLPGPVLGRLVLVAAVAGADVDAELEELLVLALAG